MTPSVHGNRPRVIGELPRCNRHLLAPGGVVRDRLGGEDHAEDGKSRSENASTLGHQGSLRISMLSAINSSAIRRSSGVVTLRFSGGDGWSRTLPPAFSTSIASSVAAAIRCGSPPN